MSDVSFQRALAVSCFFSSLQNSDTGIATTAATKRE